MHHMTRPLPGCIIQRLSTLEIVRNAANSERPLPLRCSIMLALASLVDTVARTT